MVAAALLAFREGLEAALILGIVLGVLRRVGRREQEKMVWLGASLAALVSLAAGLALYAAGISFEGKAEEVFEGLAMLLAAGVLTWMIFWMNRQGRLLHAELEGGVRKAAAGGSGQRALFGLAFLAVVREGIELALFLSAAAFAVQGGGTLPGALLGLGASILLGWLLFTATLRLDLRRFFQVTGILLILFAAGLAAHGVHEFNEAGWIPPLVEHVWDINPWLNENSTAGSILKALFGYNGNPSLTEALVYFGYFGLAALGLRRQNRAEALAG